MVDFINSDKVIHPKYSTKIVFDVLKESKGFFYLSTFIEGQEKQTIQVIMTLVKFKRLS